MTVNFYNISKRRNSTLQPSGTPVHEYTGYLRAESGVLNPVIRFEFSNNTAVPEVNYAYIPEFHRYYWVTEITAIGHGLFDFSFAVDTLASARLDIGLANKYVLRSSAASDGSIVDLKYPTKSTFTSATSYLPSNWSMTTFGGRYVVGVITPNGTFGSTAIYVLTGAEFAQLRAAIMTNNDDYYSSIQDNDLKNLAITVTNPMQYIAFCRYYPFEVARLSTSTTMKLGKMTLPDPYYLIADTGLIWGQDYTFTLTNHPLAATRGDYLNTEPFTRRYISFEPLGMLELPGSLLQGATTVKLSISIDVISGSGRAILVRNGAIRGDIYRTNFVAGIDMPIAQMVTSNPLQIISGVVNMVGSIASFATKNVVGAIHGGVSAIGDFMSGTNPQVQAFKSGTGSMLQNEPEIILREFFQDVVNEDNTEFGRPLCQIRQLNQIPGFIQCQDGEISAPFTEPELAEIESFLTGGFFYE